MNTKRGEIILLTNKTIMIIEHILYIFYIAFSTDSFYNPSKYIHTYICKLINALKLI